MSPREEILADGVRLILGDCRDVLPTLGKVDVVVTDPPYGIAFRSNYREVRYSAIENDADASLLQWACGIQAEHCKYVFCRWDSLQELPKPKSLITWVKNNWSMGDLEREHARQTEVALFYPGPAHRFPKGRPSDVVSCPRSGNEHHPTEKPVPLMRAVVEWTEGVVLDPFMGSGSTGVAAVSIGRPFVGIEIDARHFATACRRIEKALAAPSFLAPRFPAPLQEALAL